MRKIPIRRCVGCGEGKPKKELVRIVRTPSAEILLDTTSKKSGRGAYICNNKDCLAKAVKRKSLERALGASIPPEVQQRLTAQVEGECLDG